MLMFSRKFQSKFLFVIGKFTKNQKNLVSSNMSEIEKLLPDFPPGPLDVYRKQASFCWRKLITLIDGEDGVKLMVDIRLTF